MEKTFVKGQRVIVTNYDSRLKGQKGIVQEVRESGLMQNQPVILLDGQDETMLFMDWEIQILG